MSIVLLAILAVMWAAFLLPLIVPAERRQPGRARPGGQAGDGWRPAPAPGGGGAPQGSCAPVARATRAARRRPARRRSVLRRRRVLLALTFAVAASVRAWYLLGGRWWIAEAVAGALLVAYVVALVVQGFGRRRPDTPALPGPTAGPGRRRDRRRRRRHAVLPLWSAPLLEGQGPSSPE